MPYFIKQNVQKSKLFFWTFYLRIFMCQISFCQMFLNLERLLCHLNYTQTNLHTKFLGILCGSRNCDCTHTPTQLIEYDLTRLFQPLLMFPKKKKKRSPSKRVWLPKTWFGHTQQSPVPGNTGGQKKRHFWWPYRKGTSPNESHTYIHTYSKQSRESKKTQHTHTCMEYTSVKKERRGKLRKQEENMKKLLLEL